MKRLTLLVVVLACLLLTGCGRLDTTDGTWQTSPDETPCSVTLVLASDGTYILHETGLHAAGHYAISRDSITLHPDEDGAVPFTWAMDDRCITTEDELHLYRVN